jgi:hypothetical protein
VGSAGAEVASEGADRPGEAVADGDEVVASGTLLVVLDVDDSGSDVTEEVAVEGDGVEVGVFDSSPEPPEPPVTARPTLVPGSLLDEIGWPSTASAPVIPARARTKPAPTTTAPRRQGRRPSAASAAAALTGTAAPGVSAAEGCTGSSADAPGPEEPGSDAPGPVGDPDGRIAGQRPSSTGRKSRSRAPARRSEWV